MNIEEDAAPVHQQSQSVRVCDYLGLPLGLLGLNVLLPASFGLEQAVITSVFTTVSPAIVPGAAGAMVAYAAGTLLGALVARFGSNFCWQRMLGTALGAALVVTAACAWYANQSITPELAYLFSFSAGAMNVPISIAVGQAFYACVVPKKFGAAVKSQTIAVVTATAIAPLAAGLLATVYGTFAVLVASLIVYLAMWVINKAALSHHSTVVLDAPSVLNRISLPAKVLMLALLLDVFLNQWFLTVMFDYVTRLHWSPMLIGAMLSTAHLAAIVAGGLFRPPEGLLQQWIGFCLAAIAIPSALRVGVIVSAGIDVLPVFFFAAGLGIAAGLTMLLTSILRYRLVDKDTYLPFQRGFFSASVIAMALGALMGLVSVSTTGIWSASAILGVIGAVGALLFMGLGANRMSIEAPLALAVIRKCEDNVK